MASISPPPPVHVKDAIVLTDKEQLIFDRLLQVVRHYNLQTQLRVAGGWAKKSGSKLKSRIVAEQSITKWSQMIDQMEDQVAAIMQEEREERAIRKAEMEATKAENMIAHHEEIHSRPKKTWFITEKEKKLIAKGAKVESIHQYIESMKMAYLAVQRCRGDSDNPFREADRRETPKLEAVAKREHMM